MSLILENNPKNKNVVRILRACLFLTAIFKGFFVADGYYNSPSLIGGLKINGVTFYVMTIIIVGAVNFLLALACSSISFSVLSKSKWAPTADDGTCGITYCTFHLLFCISAITGFVIQGAVGMVMYFYPISSAFISAVVMKVITIFMITLLNLLLLTVIPKDKKKEMFVSMLVPNILSMLLLG